MFFSIQISGNFGVAKDALAEIASRLRVRTLRDVNAGAEPASVGSVRVSGPARNMPDGPPPAATIGPGYSGGFESFRVYFFIKFMFPYFALVTLKLYLPRVETIIMQLTVFGDGRVGIGSY